MKTYNIILFIILQSLVSVVFSQEIRNGFEITTREDSFLFPDDIVTDFSDLNMSQYKGYPRNKDGKEIVNPFSTFSSKEKLKIIECELYSAEEQTVLRNNYNMRATVVISASTGKIVSAMFSFDNLPDASTIDTLKLQELLERLKAEITYKNLTFDGHKAASGFMAGSIWLFIS